MDEAAVRFLLRKLYFVETLSSPKPQSHTGWLICLHLGKSF